MKHASFILSIVAFLVACTCGFAVHNWYSMQESGAVPLSQTQQDQVKAIVVEYHDSIQNPVFYSVKDVFDFFNSRETTESLIADFKSIPVDVLVNVAQVCLDGRPSTRLSEIVNSYKQHQTVYDKLVGSGLIEDVESLADRPCSQDSLATKAYSHNINDSTVKADESNSNPT